MATTIVTKNSTTAASVPSSGSLTQGELAVNVTDKRLFTKDSGGTVVEVGTNPSTLTVDGTTLVVDAANNYVGIGTSSPAKQLDLSANNTGITTGDPLNTLRFTDTDTTSAAGQPMGRIEWYSSDTDTASVKAFIQAQAIDGSPDADLIFATNHVSGGGTAERMRIQYDGNVGIGTSSPASALSVIKGAAGDEVARFQNSGSFGIRIIPQIGGSGSVTAIRTGSGESISFDTNNTGRMRIDSSGNVGIGTSSPTAKLDVVGTLRLTNTANSSNYGLLSDLGGLYIQSLNSNPIYFATGGSERMRIDSAGNVGIGTSSPVSKLTLSGTGTDVWMTLNRTDTNSNIIDFTQSGSRLGYVGYIGNDLNILQGLASNILFVTNNTERMRIDSSGNLRYGSSNNGVGARARFEPAFGQTTMEVVSGGDAGNLIRFNNYQSVGGTISIVLNGTTTYGTSSDYRLKENIAPMTGALAKVQSLKPVTYKWKIDGSDGQGFIAHELAEIVPDAVVGEKDAVETYIDEDGNEQTRIKPQGIDTSFLVATLTAAIQEQQAIITDLKSRIEALEQV